MMRNPYGRFALAPILAALALPAAAQDGIAYVTEDACNTVLDDLQSSTTVPEDELRYVTHVCHASRLVDFRARLDAAANPGDNGPTRALPKANERDLGGESDLDRQIVEATLQSEQSWEDLAQGDPQAAYDLLRRLIGDQGSGN